MRKKINLIFEKAIDTATPKLINALEKLDWLLLKKLCQQTLKNNTHHLSANRFHGFALSKLHQTDEAIKAYRQALIYYPDDAELLANFGSFLIDHALNLEALPLLEKLCSLRPDKAVCWNQLAHCYYAMGHHEKGLTAAEKAYELAAGSTDKLVALTQRAIHRRELGQVKEAVADCEEAIRVNPHGIAGYTNRMLFMLADPSVSSKQLFLAAKDFSTIFEEPLKDKWPDFNDKANSPWRRLQIGFLSPDFRGHPVMYFMEGLLAQLDRRQFEISCFYLYPADDIVTKRVEKHSDHFYKLADKSTEEQVKQIRDADIDLLIDLAGHTGHNGLMILARKAAPLQVSWLGFPATTGLKAIDYKFTDQITDPEGAEAEYSESLYRMQTLFCCYRPHCRNPLWRYQPAYLIRPTPALRNGFVTFGSCNNLGKLTNEVLSLWGQVLRQNTTFRLLVEGKNLDQADFADKFKQRCAGLGVPVDQMHLVGLDHRNQYLTYHDIDIALDPFPLTGGTTTFDLLWMGVPLVSMVGSEFKSRMSTGILRYLGRSEWLAKTRDEYLSITLNLASDLHRLNEIRLALRQQVEASCLMNEDLFVNEFGRGLRHIWQRWLVQSIDPQNQTMQNELMAQWQQSMPTELSQPLSKGVGIATGERLTQQEAYDQLQDLLAKALKTKSNQSADITTSISQPEWFAVTEFCETVLCALPHDPLALACLAEVEHAHHHTDFAVTYLRYAQESLRSQQTGV